MNVAIAHADRDATQLTLARAAVGECGWLLPDCEAALWHTMQRRAAMVQRWRPAYTLRQMVLKYCAIFRGKHEGRRVWVRTLRPGEKPNGWPDAKSSWEKHAPWWQRIYDRAGAYLDGQVKDPCAGRKKRGKGKPIHTGGLMDKARMNPAKWREVDCGRTKTQLRTQFFWEPR
ncbi:MAG: hypothetical protein HRU00_09755 [Myxococcales bacterium]|nr:hypothetical protein [Myxococcales bacterium]